MENADQDKDEGQLYELAYILDPGLSEERLVEQAGKITRAVEKHGGNVTLADNPKMRQLAYTIERAAGGKRRKFDRGYFGWVKFTASPSTVANIDAEAKLMSEVIRHMLIHTVKSASAFVARRRPSAEALGEAKTEERPTEAQLDQQVEELIASV